MSESINGNIEQWSISNYEIGYTCPQVCSSGGSQMLNIPKIMPDIPLGKPKSTPVPLNKSCYINDKKCKPSVATQISSQNYITVPPQDNRGFQLPWFHQGDRIFVEVRNQNPDNLFLSTKEDNSDLLP